MSLNTDKNLNKRNNNYLLNTRNHDIASDRQRITSLTNSQSGSKQMITENQSEINRRPKLSNKLLQHEDDEESKNEEEECEQEGDEYEDINNN
jgi:hypothetical protein